MLRCGIDPVRPAPSSAHLTRGPRPDRQGVDVGCHQFAHGLVHGAVTRDRTQPRERLADHVDAEVSSPVLRAGMAGMEVAFVIHLQGRRRKRRLDPGAYRRDALIAWQWRVH